MVFGTNVPRYLTGVYGTKMSYPIAPKTKAGIKRVTDDMEELLASTGKLFINKELLKLEFHAA